MNKVISFQFPGILTQYIKLYSCIDLCSTEPGRPLLIQELQECCFFEFQRYGGPKNFFLSLSCTDQHHDLNKEFLIKQQNREITS